MTDVLPKIVAFKCSFTKDDGMTVILACLETGTVETKLDYMYLVHVENIWESAKRKSDVHKRLPTWHNRRSTCQHVPRVACAWNVFRIPVWKCDHFNFRLVTV